MPIIFWIQNCTNRGVRLEKGGAFGKKEGAFTPCAPSLLTPLEHNQKKGGIIDAATGVFVKKKEGLIGTEVAQKGETTGSLFIYYLYFFCQHDQSVGVCSGRLKKWGLSCGSAKQKGGGSLPRRKHILDLYVSAPPPPPHLGRGKDPFFLFRALPPFRVVPVPKTSLSLVC